MAEEGRAEKMRRESRERRKREDMAMRRNFEVGFVGFLWWKCMILYIVGGGISDVWEWD